MCVQKRCFVRLLAGRYLKGRAWLEEKTKARGPRVGPESGPSRSRIARDRSDRRCWSWRPGRCRRRALTSEENWGRGGPLRGMALGTFSRMARGEAGQSKNALRTPQDEETLKRSYCRASFRSRLPATRFGGPSPSFLGSCSWPLMARPRPLMSHGS